ncbi:hypothetical protein HGRIS_010991 [Hohenbuehelia grisea]|uniref:Uncharacterized protein n=1 Tax=Hohenbuehelia grisea TaxID=104357 RepID=A0ABR3IYF9_9AGAR
MPSRRRGRPRSSPQHPLITAFFARFPEFDYNPQAPITSEFYRMCDMFAWDREDPERKVAKEELNDAMAQAFNDMYGTDENDIHSWHNLCRVLGIAPLPENLQQCRDAVLTLHTNLVDFVDRRGSQVHIFGSLEELREYTRNGKYFPKDNAYSGGLLKFLLREIDGRYMGRRRPGTGGRTRGGRGRGYTRRGRGRGGPR